MFQTLQIVALMLAVIAMAPAVAHAFEFPGKKRLDRDAYAAVQTIYYPGFTLLGIAEPTAIVATAVLLLLTPRDTTEFWMTFIALVGLAGMQVIYWTLTHPVNKIWTRSVATGNAGGSFFAVDPVHSGSSAAQTGDWRELRDRWEHSHIARAGLAFLGVFSLTLAIIAHG